MIVKTLSIKNITAKELKDFIINIPDDTELYVSDDGGSGYIEDCILEHIVFDNGVNSFSLEIEARSCYY